MVSINVVMALLIFNIVVVAIALISICEIVKLYNKMNNEWFNELNRISREYQDFLQQLLDMEEEDENNR